MARIIPEHLYLLILGLWVEAHKKARTVDEAKACRSIIKLLKEKCPEYVYGRKYIDDFRLS